MTDLQSPITDEERRKRKDAVDFARASVGLSGFVLDQAAEDAAARYVSGETDMAGFGKEIRALCGMIEEGDR